MAKNETVQNQDSLQADRIDGPTLKHVCQYAEWPCPACCYARGVQDGPNPRYAWTFSAKAITKTRIM